MLGFSKLATDGAGLGNQMFRYAALKGIASRRGLSFCIPSMEKMSRAFILNAPIFPEFRGQTYTEISHGFDENFVLNCPEDADLSGYFQTEKYFKHIEQEIRKDFSFRSTITEEAYPSQEFIALHARRGDYTVLGNYHPLCSVEYYETALSLLDPSLPVYVFSDDPEWCKNTFADARFRFVVCRERKIHNVSRGFFVNMIQEDTYRRAIIVRDDISSLYLMTKATQFICANSTFSWWGAWLAKDKSKVIFPKRWFGTANGHLDTKDLCYMSGVDFRAV